MKSRKFARVFCGRSKRVARRTVAGTQPRKPELERLKDLAHNAEPNFARVAFLQRDSSAETDCAVGALQYVCRAVLEANLQDLAVIAHEPSSMRIRKSDGPEAAHFRQHDPSLAFIAAFAMARMRKSAAKTTAPL